MKRLIFAQEHDIFRESVARFIDTEIAPHTEVWRHAGIVERSAYLKAGAAGLLCLWADPQFGGTGVDDLRFDQIVIEESVRRGDIAFYIHLHSNLVAPYIDKLGSSVLRSRLMPKIVSGEIILAIAMTEAAKSRSNEGDTRRRRLANQRSHLQ